MIQHPFVLLQFHLFHVNVGVLSFVAHDIVNGVGIQFDTYILFTFIEHVHIVHALFFTYHVYILLSITDFVFVEFQLLAVVHHVQL